MNNGPYSACGNAILGAEPTQAVLSGDVLASNFLNVFGRQLLFPRRASPLFRSVGHVVSVRTNKQMMRVNTSGDVAAMANKHPGGDRAVVNHVTDAMRRWAIPWAKMQASISAPACAARPHPALALGATRYAVPEQTANTFWNAIIQVKHRNLHSGGARCVCSTAAPLFCMGIIAQSRA